VEEQRTEMLKVLFAGIKWCLKALKLNATQIKVCKATHFARFSSLNNVFEVFEESKDVKNYEILDIEKVNALTDADRFI
jgi:hypothetical protein